MEPAAPTAPPFSRRDWIAASLLVAAVLAAAWPVLSADFYMDDWLLLALGQHMSTPGPFYAQYDGIDYFYRPNGLALWWLSTRLFGVASAMPHALLNLALHFVAALLVAAIVRGFASRWAAWMAAALFALHPATLGAAFWLSDRFDLLATIGVLWLVLCVRDPRWKWPWIVVAAALAAGSKEIGLAALPAVYLLLAFGPARDDRWRVAILATLPFVAMLVVRALLLRDAVNPLAHPTDLSLWTQGFPAWSRALPAALVRRTWDITAFGIWLGLASATLWSFIRIRRDAVPAALLSLVFATGVLQSPVAPYILVPVERALLAQGGRFFHLAFAALAIVMAKRVAGFAPIIAIVLAFASHSLAVDWRDRLAPPKPVAAALGAALGRHEPPADCRIRLANVDDAFVDVMAKARLPRGDARLDCLVVTDTGPWYAVVSARRCTADADLGDSVHRYGNLCLVAKPKGGENASVWRWDEAKRRFDHTSTKP